MTATRKSLRIEITGESLKDLQDVLKLLSDDLSEPLLCASHFPGASSYGFTITKRMFNSDIAYYYNSDQSQDKS